MSAPAAPGDGALAGRAAEHVLQLILRGIHPELLDNWLALARSARLALPHACLVPLIELAIQRRPLRSAVEPLLGERGRWLVVQHPEWSEVFGADVAGVVSQDNWELGSLAQRVAALTALRSSNPGAALARLEADWAQEPAENRIALLPCLSTGLSLADEVFLERALDDKRKEVRSVAQQLLGTLPGSLLRERCKTRLLALLDLDRTATPTLLLQLPQECDKAMKRDGIGMQTYHSTGEKAGWLQDMMRCVAPQFWSEHWQLAPRAVIDLFGANEFSVVLLTGLAQAAARGLDASPDARAIAWFITLLDDPTQRAGIHIPGLLMPSLDRLPPAEQAGLLERWLGDASGNPNAFHYAMRWAEQQLGQGAERLSPQMAELLLLRAMQRHMLAAPQHNYSTEGYLRTLGRVLNAGDPAYAATGWPPAAWEHWPQWRPLVDEMLETLNFRHTMQASFLENDA